MTRSVRTTSGKVRVTWLGHSAFRIETPSGTVVMVDPWLDNPSAPPGVRPTGRVDAIFVTHGHGDHIGNTVEIARATGAVVYANYEVSLYLKQAGVPHVEGMNKSGSVRLDNVEATMVDATHSSGIETGEGMLAGGDPAGYVFRFKEGASIYHAGDTGVFGDMKLIAELYRPQLAILPIGGFYTMGPREAAKACQLLTPRLILGMHYGTFPVLSGTPAELKKLLPSSMRTRLRVLKPGESLQVP